MAAKSLVVLSALGITPSSYDAAQGEIRIPRRNISLIKTGLFEVWNTDTNKIIMDTKTAGLGATVTLPLTGDAVIKLDTSDMGAKGSNNDTLNIMTRVSSSLVPDVVSASTNTILNNSAFKNSEVLADFAGQGQGEYGFKIITSSTGVTANFSAVVCMSDGTILSNTCTTGSGDSDVSNYSLVTGTTLTAPWTHVAVDAGAVLAYYAERP